MALLSTSLACISVSLLAHFIHFIVDSDMSVMAMLYLVYCWIRYKFWSLILWSCIRISKIIKFRFSYNHQFTCTEKRHHILVVIYARCCINHQNMRARYTCQLRFLTDIYSPWTSNLAQCLFPQFCFLLVVLHILPRTSAHLGIAWPCVYFPLIAFFLTISPLFGQAQDVH